MKNTPAVILAAGESSRFWPLNSRHKALFWIMGKPILWYTIQGLRKAGIKNIAIVQSAKKDVENDLTNYRFAGTRITYVTQKEPKGMGNALWQARNLLKSPFFVLNAERVDVYEIMQNAKIRNQNEKSKSSILLFCQKTANPYLFGVVRLRGERVLDIIEKPQKGKEPSHMKLVGVYLLGPDFFKYYEKTKRRIYDFEDALSLCAKENKVRAVMVRQKEESTPSLKYPWHLFGIAKYLFDKHLKPSIAKSATIARNAVIEGKVYVGNNVQIFENAVIKGPCSIGENSIIGNNALVREYTNIERGGIVGAYAELTRTIFQEDVHCHSGFLGDSIFDRGCRIGAGVITANRRFDRGSIKTAAGEKIDTGLTSFGVAAGREVSFGIHASTMPGVLIGNRSVIGPHSMVKENIPDDTLFFTEYKAHQKSRRT